MKKINVCWCLWFKLNQDLFPTLTRWDRLQAHAGESLESESVLRFRWNPMKRSQTRLFIQILSLREQKTFRFHHNIAAVVWTGTDTETCITPSPDGGFETMSSMRNWSNHRSAEVTSLVFWNNSANVKWKQERNQSLWFVSNNNRRVFRLFESLMPFFVFLGEFLKLPFLVLMAIIHFIQSSVLLHSWFQRFLCFDVFYSFIYVTVNSIKMLILSCICVRFSFIKHQLMILTVECDQWGERTLLKVWMRRLSAQTTSVFLIFISFVFRFDFRLKPASLLWAASFRMT